MCPLCAADVCFARRYYVKEKDFVHSDKVVAVNRTKYVALLLLYVARLDFTICHMILRVIRPSNIVFFYGMQRARERTRAVSRHLSFCAQTEYERLLLTVHRFVLLNRPFSTCALLLFSKEYARRP